MIAFAYMSLMVEGSSSHAQLENGGFLKGISINDSPLGGVSSDWGYSLLGLASAKKCSLLFGGYTAMQELQQLYSNAPDKNKLGESASIVSLLKLGTTKTNQEVATDAANDGVVIIVVGFTSNTDITAIYQESTHSVYLNDSLFSS